MKTFDVQTVAIEAPADAVFAYVADPSRLPEWTHAFQTVANGRATLRTPRGAAEIGLEVRASLEHGTVDWLMTFPDGSVGRAHSRVVAAAPRRSVYSFVLLAPPVPLEQVEGALEEQGRTLAQELLAVARTPRASGRGGRTMSSGPHPSGETLEQLASRAVVGERAALEALVRRVQDPVYRLALRMLWHPEDARDATQEILIRIVTRLGTFRGESALLTWVYRVAANYLLTARKSRLEEQRLTFEAFGADLEEGLAEPSKSQMGAEEALLVEEVKIGCTLGMLACLDRPHRLAYVLGEILEMDHEEAARVLEITPAAFRKRLSRARRKIVAFTRARCGLIDPSNACRCRRRVSRAIALGRVDARHLLFAQDAARAQAFPEVVSEIRRLEILRRATALYRSHPDFSVPEDFTRRVRQLLEGSATGSDGT